MLDGIMTGWNYDITTKKRDNLGAKLTRMGIAWSKLMGYNQVDVILELAQRICVFFVPQHCTSGSPGKMMILERRGVAGLSLEAVPFPQAQENHDPIRLRQVGEHSYEYYSSGL